MNQPPEDSAAPLTGAPDQTAGDHRQYSCLGNCSGNGECIDGHCYCLIRYDGPDCRHINFSYHVAFASIFFLLALTSLIQLAMCVHAEYLRMKKNRSILRACRLTTQKVLYFLVFLATIVRAAYFAAPTLGSEWSTSLLSAYYPMVLTSSSLIVCFWAEVFHLREIRWDRPRFISKSFIGFAAFNFVSYSLLIAELLLVWWPPEENDNESPQNGYWKQKTLDLDPVGTSVDGRVSGGGGGGVRREFYAHIFNGCYAVLMFIVVIFFLIYGVEVFFKVRGGFMVSSIPHLIGSARINLVEVGKKRNGKTSHRSEAKDAGGAAASDLEGPLTLKIMASTRQLRSQFGKKSVSRGNSREEKEPAGASPRTGDSDSEEAIALYQVPEQAAPLSPGSREQTSQEDAVFRLQSKDEVADHQSHDEQPWSGEVQPDNGPVINTSQLHQSRLGLLSQALMMITVVGFLFADTMKEFWKTKVNLTSRNTHDVLFRTLEIGVALWFPCVLWNCIRPEQLWCLNPKKIVENRFQSKFADSPNEKPRQGEGTWEESTTDEDEKGPECWICYDPDRTDGGPIIHPCECKGDVGSVHHDCLRRWLVESADNPDALKCKVCSSAYMVKEGSQFSLKNGFTAKQWMQTASLVTIMCLTMGGMWAVIQLYSEPWIRSLAVGVALIVQYLCLRSLGVSTVTAYQRAKVSALKIVNIRIGRASRSEQPRSHNQNPRRSDDVNGHFSIVEVELSERMRSSCDPNQ